MHVHILSESSASPPRDARNWLNLSGLADVDVTSEDPARPIEGALFDGSRLGWRAARPGEQLIRIRFRRPQTLRRIRLVFVEEELERTHEYLLRWSPASEGPFQDIVRQQWNFNPLSARTEVAQYDVHLGAVCVLEVIMVPDISGGNARATLQQIRLA